MRKKHLAKKIIMCSLSGLLIFSGFMTQSFESHAGMSPEVIAELQKKGLGGKTTGGRSVCAPGYEYNGSYELLSQYAKDENDQLVRDRAAERGLTIRQYLEQTGQTCPPSSPNYAILDKDLSGNGSTAQKEEVQHKHSYKEEVTKEPTCMETGLKTFTCECGNSYTEAVEKTEHSYKDEITKLPTCKEKGEKTFICSVCGDSYVEELPKTDHEAGASYTTKDATCTEDGLKEVFCKYCGEALKRQLVEALGHEAGEEVEEQTAGIFSKGKAVIRCERCNEVMEERELPSLATQTVEHILSIDGRVMAGAIVAVAVLLVLVLAVIFKKKNKRLS